MHVGPIKENGSVQSFIVILYKVNDFWFDKKVASTSASHKIQYDASKNRYRITRSWEETGIR